MKTVTSPWYNRRSVPDKTSVEEKKSESDNKPRTKRQLGQTFGTVVEKVKTNGIKNNLFNRKQMVKEFMKEVSLTYQ